MTRRLKIIVDENMPLVNDVLQDLADLEYYPGRSINKQVVSDADALLIRSVTKVTPSMIENSSCQFVGTATIGTDHIEEQVQKLPGVKVVSAPGCNAQSVAEYVLSAVLYYLTCSEIRKGSRAKSTLHDVESLTVGIIGGGNTGTAVANVLKLLGFTCVIYDPLLARAQSSEHKNNSCSKGHRVYGSWDAILKADIVSLHVPFTTESDYPTASLINENNIADFNAELIINACRGGVLTSQAVLNAAPLGKVSFILDVFEGEPKVNTKEIELALICTPHIAGYSRNGKLAGSIQVIKALCEHFQLPLNDLPKLNYIPLKASSASSNEDVEAGSKVNALLELAAWWKSHVYDIRADDKNFRDAAKHFPASFDSLRKHYNHREEVGFEALSGWFTKFK
jgi:erythronate-4-phosphate dehydrogenase